MKLRNQDIGDMVIRRKIIHMASGLLITFLIYKNIIGAREVFIFCIFGFIISMLCKRFKIPFFSWVLKMVEEPKQTMIFPGRGALFFLLGVIMVLSIRHFTLDIALASIAILTVADPVSHLVGVQFGRIKHPLSLNKLVEGNIAGAIVGFFAAMRFVTPLEAGVASITAMIVEALEVEVNHQAIDDNLLVPLAAGTAIYLLRLYV
ncbi:hypothetical protein COT48_06280 [Candidatus Woesearchaeota archaeon CG08_land_8_20_14_0_20_47_9]|nr:MAG: hypothetical protein COT48_06280 [Candidatus Woesearchaeota archaeon CG08_land_8_20_14_0_20_47_9]